MTVSYQHFAIPDQFKTTQILAILQTRYDIRVEPCKTITRTIFDTFNWSLYQKDARIEMQQINRKNTIVWHATNKHPGKTILNLNTMPVFAHNLAPSAFKQNLVSLIGVRALQPQIIINIKSSPLSVINNEGKALVRIVLDEMTCTQSGAHRAHKLCKLLTVQKIKGYNEDFLKVAAFVETQSFMPAYNNLLKLALLTLNIAPSKFSSSFKVKLDQKMTTIDACRNILNNLLNVVKLNKTGATEGLDTEFLHNLRIAVRKSRSVLTRIKQVFPVSHIRQYISEFTWLGQATTPVRDLDVYLLSFDAYSHSVAEKYRKDLQPLHAFLQQQRDIEQRKLVEIFHSNRFNKLITDWHAFLAGHFVIGLGPNAPRNVSSLADEFIWRLYRKVLKDGKAIKPKSPDEDLHELRKTCKKLRYLMEFFASLYPPHKFNHAIKALKRFQTLLGDFQDYSVQILMLKQFLENRHTAGALTKGTTNAVNALIATLQKRQEIARKNFSGAFRVFSSDINQAEFRLLFIGTHTKNQTDKTADNMAYNS